MTTKKSNLNKKTASYKIGGKIGHLAVELIAGKDKLVEMAGGAIESVKSAIENITTAKKPTPKKASKRVTKKATTKSPRTAIQKPAKVAAVKKSTPSKKAAKPVTAKKTGATKKATKAANPKKATASKK